MNHMTLQEINVKEATDLDDAYIGVANGDWHMLTPFYDDFYCHDCASVYEISEIDIIFRLPGVGEVIDQKTAA